MQELQTFISEYLPWLRVVGLVLLKASLIVVLGWYLARFLSKKVHKILHDRDEILANFASQVVFVVLMVVCAISALGALGVQTASILAVVGTAGLAIALALKDSLSSIASGIILIILRPFKKGDTIEVNGISGKVESLNLFNTFITLPDDRTAILPNRNIVNANIINATKSPLGRVDWTCSVGHGSDIERVKEIIISVIYSLDNVNKDREVFVGINELTTNSIEFIVRFWVKREDGILKARSMMIEQVKKELDSQGVQIPYQQVDVHIKADECK